MAALGMKKQLEEKLRNDTRFRRHRDMGRFSVPAPQEVLREAPRPNNKVSSVVTDELIPLVDVLRFSHTVENKLDSVRGLCAIVRAASGKVKEQIGRHGLLTAVTEHMFDPPQSRAWQTRGASDMLATLSLGGEVSLVSIASEASESKLNRRLGGTTHALHELKSGCVIVLSMLLTECPANVRLFVEQGGLEKLKLAVVSNPSSFTKKNLAKIIRNLAKDKAMALKMLKPSVMLWDLLRILAKDDTAEAEDSGMKNTRADAEVCRSHISAVMADLIQHAEVRETMPLDKMMMEQLIVYLASNEKAAVDSMLKVIDRVASDLSTRRKSSGLLVSEIFAVEFCTCALPSQAIHGDYSMAPSTPGSRPGTHMSNSRMLETVDEGTSYGSRAQSRGSAGPLSVSEADFPLSSVTGADILMAFLNPNLDNVQEYAEEADQESRELAASSLLALSNHPDACAVLVDLGASKVVLDSIAYTDLSLKDIEEDFKSFLGKERPKPRRSADELPSRILALKTGVNLLLYGPDTVANEMCEGHAVLIAGESAISPDLKCRIASSRYLLELGRKLDGEHLKQVSMILSFLIEKSVGPSTYEEVLANTAPLFVRLLGSFPEILHETIAGLPDDFLDTFVADLAYSMNRVYTNEFKSSATTLKIANSLIELTVMLIGVPTFRQRIMRSFKDSTSVGAPAWRVMLEALTLRPFMNSTRTFATSVYSNLLAYSDSRDLCIESGALSRLLYIRDAKAIKFPHTARLAASEGLTHPDIIMHCASQVIQRSWTLFHRALSGRSTYNTYSARKEESMLTSDNSADFAGQLNRDLWSACASHEPEIVEMLLDCGAKVNSRSPTHGDRAALRIAGDADGPTIMLLETVKHILKHVRVAVDQEASDGMTALHSALTRGKHELARLLLQKGADLTKCTADGRTGLICAVSSGTVPVVVFCLDSTDDVHGLLNTPAPDGAMAIEVALRLGAHEVVEVLVAHGAEMPPDSEESPGSPQSPGRQSPLGCDPTEALATGESEESSDP